MCLCSSDWLCVCMLMGGIRTLFGFKKLRRGRGRPFGPLAVIHVKSLKTRAPLFCWLCRSLNLMPVPSVQLVVNFHYFHCEIPLVANQTPAFVTMAVT